MSEIDCTACGKPIEYDAVDTGGHREPELFDSKLLLSGKRVGTAYADGVTYCSPCDEEN